MKRLVLLLVVVWLAGLSQMGCSNGRVLGGAAVGAAGAGAAYEIQAKRQMDRLEEDYRAGRIDRREYESRKRQIEAGSIIY